MTPPIDDSGRVNVSVDFPSLSSIHSKLSDHGESLSSIKTDIALLRKDLNGRIPKIEGRQDEFAEDLRSHDRQINRWQGAVTILAFIVLLIGGVVVEQWHSFSHEAAPTHGQP